MACGCPVVAWAGSATLGGVQPQYASSSSSSSSSLSSSSSSSSPSSSQRVGSGAIEEVAGDAAVWVPAQRGALALALTRLAQEPAARAEHQRRGFRRARLFDDWGAAADQWVSVVDGARRVTIDDDR